MKKSAGFAASVVMVVAIISMLPVGAHAQTSGQVIGQPQLSFATSAGDLEPGTTNEITISVTNRGEIDRAGPSPYEDRVTTARGMTITAQDGNVPIDFKSGQVSVGNVPTGTANVPVTVAISADAEPGVYQIPIEYEYQYTRIVSYDSSGAEYRDLTASNSKEITIRVDDNARFEIVNTIPEVQIGDSGTLTTTIENIGGQEATDISVGLESSSPRLLFDRSRQDSAYIDSLAPGEQTNVTYDVTVDSSATVRQYTIYSTVRYEGPDGIQAVDNDLSVGITPQEEQQFRLENIESELYVGSDGEISGVVTNEGPNTARNVAIRYMDETSNLTPIFETVSVGTLAPEESNTFTLPIRVSSESEPISQVISVGVQYRNSGSERNLYEDLVITTEIGPEQRFSLENIESELYVGEDGQISGVVNNEGPNTAQNVAIRYADETSNLIPITETVSVGTLDPGESSTFTLPIGVSGEAEPTIKGINLAVQYRNFESEQRVYEDLEITTEIAPERDQFLVEIQDQEIQNNGQTEIDVAVTNNLDESATNVEARMFADDPFDTGETDTGYIQSLSPGETKTITLDLSASSSATPGNTYPISFDFRYDDSDGDSQLTDTIRSPIDVVEAEDGGLPIPLPIIIVALLIAGTGALVIYRRRP